MGTDSHTKKVFEWLSAPDTSVNLNEALEKREEGTGIWFLQSEPFQEWKARENGFLWLHGIPGCGKTVLSATTIEHLIQQSSHVTLQFFFDFNDADKLSLDKLLRALVSQLYVSYEDSQHGLNELFSSFENGHQQPTYQALLTTFLQMTKGINIQIVIDALDECNTRSSLLSWIESLASQKHKGLRVLLTSRREESIEADLTRWLQPNNIMDMDRESVNWDIRTHIRARLKNDRAFKRWHSKPAVQEEIETELTKNSGGM